MQESPAEGGAGFRLRGRTCSPYMLAVPKHRETMATCGRIIGAQAEVADLSKQVELALFFDARLDLGALYA